MRKQLTYTVKIFPFLKINILFFPVLCASMLGNYHTQFILSYLCALLHEMAHVLSARALGVGISYIEIQPFGICAKLKSSVIQNPIHEILIAASGPLSNIIITIIFYTIYRRIDYFICCNLAMACINLVPALPLDGGRIMRALLSMHLGALRAYNIAVKVSRIPVAVILLASVYGLLTARFNFSLILIGVFLLGNLYSEQINISKSTLLEILHYKDKLKQDEFRRCIVIVANASTPARHILKQLAYNRYHIIHVTDDDLQITKTLSEGELLHAILKSGIRVTLAEI